MATVFQDLPASAFWRTGVVNPGPLGLTDLIRPKFQITRDTAVATAGSCFAQHVGTALRGAGLTVLDVEPAPPGLDEATAKTYGFNLYSARYGNIYTTGQLRQLLQDATLQNVRADAVWQKGLRFYDGIRPGIEPNGCDSAGEVLALRAFHLNRVRALFTTAQVFVFTLGLTECWHDPETGTFFPVAPGVICDPEPGRNVAFFNHSLSDILSDLAEVRRLLHGLNPDMRLILSVSPVPLTATASGSHVLTASTAAKSTLRAAVQDFTARMPDVDYMPSYEIITNPAARSHFFAQNLRSVTQEGVDLVMSQFLAAHGLAPAMPAPPQTDPAPNDPDSLICEEALAEAFHP